MPTTYRFAPALLARFLGALLVLAGLLVLVVAGLVAWLDLPRAVLTAAVVLAVAVVVGTGLAGSRLTPLVRFDEAGYRVRLLRGAGVRQARWREVEDAVATELSGHRCVVLRLRDGRTTTIPVEVLDTDTTAFLEDLRSHLDRGRGYRRLA